MKYKIVETTGEKGYLQALDMWLQVFPNSAELKKKYPWYYVNKHFPSSLYLLKEHEKPEVLGAIGLVSRHFNLFNKNQVVGLCSDFAINKNHQTASPALQLLKSLIKSSKDKCDILLGFPNNNSILVMRRAGFHILDELPRYALVLKSEPYIEKLPLSIFKFLITIPLNFLIKFHFWLTRSFNFSDYQLTEITEIDGSFDKLWLKFSQNNNLYIGKRNSEYLNWRFISNPRRNFRIFALNHRKNHDLVGYAVIKISKEMHWYVYDFFTISNDTVLKCLLQKLIAKAIQEKAVSLSLEFLGNHEVTNILSSLRFSKRNSDRKVIFYSVSNHVDMDNLSNVDNWYLTSADELG